MLTIDLSQLLPNDDDYERIHRSLVGSPSYINSEVFLNKDEKVLIIGKENDHNMILVVK